MLKCPCAARKGIRVSRGTAPLILRLVNSQPWVKRSLPIGTYYVEGWVGPGDIPNALEREEVHASVGNRTAFLWLSDSWASLLTTLYRFTLHMKIVS